VGIVARHLRLSVPHARPRPVQPVPRFMRVGSIEMILETCEKLAAEIRKVVSTAGKAGVCLRIYECGNCRNTCFKICNNRREVKLQGGAVLGRNRFGLSVVLETFGFILFYGELKLFVEYGPRRWENRGNRRRTGDPHTHHLSCDGTLRSSAR
jgi:hypothetical protein